MAYSVAPYVLDAIGPFNGKLAFDNATGDFLYTPGFYPPDPLNTAGRTSSPSSPARTPSL